MLFGGCTAKTKIVQHFSDIKGLKLTLENRLFKSVSDALYRAVNTWPYFTE